jgi:hypothetical protein
MSVQSKDGHIRPKYVVETSVKRETGPSETECVKGSVKYHEEFTNTSTVRGHGITSVIFSLLYSRNTCKCRNSRF